MHLTVKGKQLDVGDALRTHVADSLSNMFGKYFGDAIEATVVFSRERHLYRAMISVHVGRGILLQGQDDADQPYPAYDGAAEKVAKRLRRYKRRLRDHHRTESQMEQRAQLYVLASESDEQEETPPAADGKPAVIAEMVAEIRTLTVSEAVELLELADEGAILFRNQAHGGLNMVYRRTDGNVGWVDPRDN
jgi:ribosomal subunit interface protein